MRAQDGYTALMMAAEWGHADCARLLLDAGADKKATNEVCLSIRGVSESAVGIGDGADCGGGSDGDNTFLSAELSDHYDRPALIRSCAESIRCACHKASDVCSDNAFLFLVYRLCAHSVL